MTYTRVISSDHTKTVEIDQVPVVNDNDSQLGLCPVVNKQCEVATFIDDNYYGFKLIDKIDDGNENRSQLSKE